VKTSRDRFSSRLPSVLRCPTKDDRAPLIKTFHCAPPMKVSLPGCRLGLEDILAAFLTLINRVQGIRLFTIIDECGHGKPDGLAIFVRMVEGGSFTAASDNKCMLH
jgi:hypothetical protein